MALSRTPISDAGRKIKANGLQARPGKMEVSKRKAQQRQSSLKQKAQLLLPTRQRLPIWSQREYIRQNLRSTDVMLLVGETGSGKSTQVPQFLLHEEWCKPSHRNVDIEGGDSKSIQIGGCIAVTEPRRVAAVTLARRVAEEMGTPLGASSPASKVGYSVRFDNSTSPNTKIKFLTEGMLLQEMLRDPGLRQYSAVIVDEVHERSVNVDMILGFMHRLLRDKKERCGVPLKVVVMSATANTEGLLKFFERDYPELDNAHRDSPNGYSSLPNEPEWNGFSDEEELSQAGITIANEHALSNTFRASVVHIPGRQFPIKIVYSPDPVRDFVDSALRTIFQLHYREPLPGDILVFLTGQETIESLEKLVNDYALGLGPEVPKVLVLPLFAALPQSLQQRVFYPTPARTRKIILSTNIAETSVTVSGVRYVVDCGRSKIKQFRPSLGLDSLLVKAVSKSAATQRMGRAGREAAGQCYRLYTEKDYYALQDSQTPEIMRCDLAQAILNMKARGIDDVRVFPFLDRPRREALERALLQLLQLDALEEHGKINEIGLKVAKLPVSVSLGRVLVEAMEKETECLAEVVDIISCLSVESIFLNLTSEEAKEKAESARAALYRREGDHLTLLATVQAYASETSDRKLWADKHFVSHRAMQAVMVSSIFLLRSHN